MDSEKENMDDVMLEHKASEMMIDPSVIKSKAKRNKVFLAMRDYCAKLKQEMEKST